MCVLAGIPGLEQENGGALAGTHGADPGRPRDWKGQPSNALLPKESECRPADSGDDQITGEERLRLVLRRWRCAVCAPEMRFIRCLMSAESARRTPRVIADSLVFRRLSGAGKRR